MDDKNFCIEYVRRIPRPTKTKVNREMVEIVEKHILIPRADMFDDKALEHLFPNNVTAFVYAFIRDNQELFL